MDKAVNYGGVIVKGDSQYWNVLLETLSRDKLRKLQIKKFKSIFEWAYNNSKFHRGLYDNAGIKPDDIRSFHDIRRVPKVEKSMMQPWVHV